MMCLRILTTLCVSLSCLGLILPVPLLEAAQARQPPRQPIPAAPDVCDVELQPGGVLQAVVVNEHGVPLAGEAVGVWRANRELVRTATDSLGCFCVDGLHGATYRITARGAERWIRAWAAGTAPPRTSRTATITIGGDVVRGQRPLGEFLLSNGVLLTGMVAAMIAIPIAIHQSNRGPSSP